MVNATWMAARPQWYFWSIGLTNSVQPYCRLAIITMQMMPKINWPQRVASDAVARDEIASVVLVVTVSSIPAVLIELSDETSRLAADPYLGARLLSAALDTFSRSISPRIGWRRMRSPCACVSVGPCNFLIRPADNR
jgi:hypothetical protein